MADTVTSQTIQDGERVAILVYNDLTVRAISVKEVDVSALPLTAAETCTPFL